MVNVWWIRRDIRTNDNAALYHALKSGQEVLPIFIFDTSILNDLPKDDARVTFIQREISELNNQLAHDFGSGIKTYHGKPVDIWEQIIKENKVDTVFTNRDYEPYARDRDEAVKSFLLTNGIKYQDYKDHVIFQYDEVLKADGTPYTVFTPYKNKWYEKLNSHLESGLSQFLKPYPSQDLLSSLHPLSDNKIHTLVSMGFSHSSVKIPKKEVARILIKKYESTRNFPSIEGTSRLGIHFRFGTISIREKALKAQGLSTTYLNELVWRDFYSMIIGNFPRVISNSFRKEYDQINWRNNEGEFKKWKEGKTGYPIVDAGMRELMKTGYMHNRVRMITASFLTKHLLIDWRWGEAHFAEKLLDFDLASNNGGWQWASGSGTDAAPYFRIFSPAAQQEKFDKNYTYVKKWVPEFGTSAYPEPIVDHKEARERCLAAYKDGLNRN